MSLSETRCNRLIGHSRTAGPPHLRSSIRAYNVAVVWGLWGLFQFDLVAAIGGGQSATLSRIVYSLVGLAGVVLTATASAIHGRLPLAARHG